VKPVPSYYSLQAWDEPWDHLLPQDSLTAFQSDAWRTILLQGGYQVRRWLVTDQNHEQPSAGWSAIHHGPPFLRVLTTPLLTPYLGWSSHNLAPHNAESILQAIAMQIPIWRVSSPPHFPSAASPANSPFASQPDTTNPAQRQTSFLDLRRPFHQILHAASSSAKRQYHKNLRDNAWSIEASSDSCSLSWTEAEQLLRLVWQRRGLAYPIPSRLLKSVWCTTTPSGFRRFWVARHDAGPRAFVLTVEDRRTIFYAVAACHPDALSSGVATRLIFCIVEDAVARGLQQFDLVGANSESLARFKAGLGGQVLPYREHSVACSPWGKLIFLIRRARQRLG
jgi:hypothetical protein